MKAYCNPWKTLATLLFAAALYNLEEKRGQSALSLCWEILLNGSQVIHCLKLTSFLCLCFSKSTVSKPDKSWTFSLLKACQGYKYSKGCGEWKTVGMQSGGGRRKTRWAHQAFLCWHMMPAWFWGTPCLSAPWDPKDREGRGSVCVIGLVLSLCDCTATWLPLVWIPDQRFFWTHPDCPRWMSLDCIH